ncbi:glycosyltransferase family 4 protein [Halopelagius longus]|uniref:Glycosyltransferase family 1 protein n=1 Tax=Halopelagius longus TaxID=1236180 RepID=A0A1H1ANZ9_9EURY|nr:glycosyltransferase family 4 protein [Halopelagius longus]RDI70458.1 glycosyltransferase family 1 protein [Halopelagius longus]SDQ41312.1 Glycosyltransferase involved in cell wall bisynthesis [Halopelagius longus]
MSSDKGLADASVGILTPRYPPTMHGGGEVSVRLLAEHLADSDRVGPVTVYSFDGRGREVRSGVEIKRLGYVPTGIHELSNAFGAVRSLRHVDEIAAHDVLHSYNVELNPLAGYLSKAHGVPTVATLNSYDVLPKSAIGVSPKPSRRAYERIAMPTTGRLVRRCMKEIDVFVTLSEASKEVYVRNGFDDHPYEVVPNMRDPDFEPQARDEPPGSGRSVTLLYVGSLIKEKGVDTLVRSLRHLDEEYRLDIVGSGPEASALRTLAADIGVEDRIDFRGRVPYEEVVTSYASSDVFVHPGRWPEPFGRTILEAMESGLPVVVTDIGGPTEIITDDELKCSVDDSREMADAIRYARDDAASIGSQNKNRVRDEFSPARVTDRMLTVYERLLD